VFYFSITLIIGSLCWFYSSPDWEPALFFISSLAGAIYAKPDLNKLEFRRYKLKIGKLYAKKIYINKENEMTISSQDLENIISKAILNDSPKLNFKHLYACELIEYANKKEKDSDLAHSFKKRAKRINDDLNLVDEGFERLVWLCKKQYLNLPISQVADIFRKLVLLIYQSPEVPRQHRKLDVYINSKEVGQIGYPIWIHDDLFSELVHRINKPFNTKGTELMCIPYNFYVADMPESIINNEVVPAHILYSMIRYSKLKDNNNYWQYSSWFFGLG
jgi:hypothetical protein